MQGVGRGIKVTRNSAMLLMSLRASQGPRLDIFLRHRAPSSKSSVEKTRFGNIAQILFSRKERSIANKAFCCGFNLIRNQFTQEATYDIPRNHAFSRWIDVPEKHQMA